jgi:hypothetical protein
MPLPFRQCLIGVEPRDGELTSILTRKAFDAAETGIADTSSTIRSKVR